MRSAATRRSTAPKKVLIPAVVFGASGLLLGGTAFAAPMAAAPGDNGDVKIHRLATDDMDQRNEPKVCRFYLVGFNFDANHDLAYRIVKGPPFKSAAALTGDIDINAQGYGRTGALSLPDGQYKLFVTFADENGRAKQKVFKVDCPATVPVGDPDPDTDPDPGTDSENDPGTDAEETLNESLPDGGDVDDADLPVGGVATGGGAMAMASDPANLPIALFGGGLIALVGLSARRVWLRS